MAFQWFPGRREISLCETQHGETPWHNHISPLQKEGCIGLIAAEAESQKSPTGIMACESLGFFGPKTL